MASKADLDDEFFGDLHDTAVIITEERNTSLDCLQVAESTAIERQFRNLGFHEAFEEYKDSLLQEGFEAGYRETFEAAVRLGHLLGKVTAKAKLPSHPSTTPDETYLQAARLTRQVITQTDGLTNASLQDLEEKVSRLVLNV